MIHSLPIEHLSPTQLKALKSLKSNQPVEIRSNSINEIIEIINLLIEKGISISCNPRTLRYLQNYKDRHLQTESKEELEKLANAYHSAILKLKSKYNFCYPKTNLALRHQYLNVLGSYDFNSSTDFDLDSRLKGSPLSISENTIDQSKLFSIYKRTWNRYIDIDPLMDKYYLEPINETLPNVLEIWIKKVNTISHDIRTGLKEIVDEERNRILSIKKQLTQHLVNYQHSQSDLELDKMRQKIGFLLADLPNENENTLSELVMYAVSNWPKVTSKYLSRHSRRFNSRNHQSVIIYDAMHELRTLLTEINENGFIKVEVSNTPLSYEKQIIKVEGLLSQLLHCKHWIIDEAEYITWKRFYTSLSEEDKAIIDVLISLEKDNQQNQLKYMEIQKWKDKASANGVITSDDSLTVFEAYKNLNNVIDWSLVNLSADTLTTGDYQISFDGVDYRLSNTIKKDDKNSIVLIDKNLDDIEPMVTLDYYSRIKQANQLTDAIIASKAKIKVYQTKTVNIISCLRDIDNEKVNSILASSKINELKGESEAELVKGSILAEDQEKIILVYDDLINVNETQHYFWQRLVLQCMSSAGYKVISINTEDTFNHIDLEEHLYPYTNHQSNISTESAI